MSKKTQKNSERMVFCLEVALFFIFFSLSFILFLNETSAEIGENATLVSEFDVGSSPPNILAIDIESGSVNLVPNSSRGVNCSVIIEEYDGDVDLASVDAELFGPSSFYGDSDDNNFHYTNSSCSINLSYGDSFQAQANCLFDVYYYAEPGVWNCSVTATDFSSYSDFKSNSTVFEELLAVAIPDAIDYGLINATYVSDEQFLNVTNAGNVRINLSLSGYGGSEGDGHAMNCSLGNTYIPVGYEGYNLSESVPGILSLSEFENFYVNLSSSPVTKYFGLDFRHDDVSAGNDDTNSTYWRIYVPASVGGTCSGSIVVGATQAPGV